MERPHHSVTMIAAGVGAIGLVALLYLRSQSAASDASAASTDATSTVSSLPVSVSTDPSGQYASYTTASDSGTASSDAAAPSTIADATNNVATFGTILAALLGSNNSATANLAATASANNAAITSSVQQLAQPATNLIQQTQAAAPAAPAPVQPQSTAVASTPPAPTGYTGPKDLSEVVNGMLTYNPTWYAEDANYRSDWDQHAAQSTAAFGSNWNSVAAGANQSVLNQGLGATYDAMQTA
jgi:hypothetical protein